MNSNKKLILSVPLVSILIWLLIFADYSNPRRTIFFRFRPKLNASYILGYIPTNYAEHYSEHLLESNERYNLILVDYQNYSSLPERFILLENKNGKKNEQILFDRNNMGWRMGSRVDVLTPLINIQLFNKYIELSQSYDEESIRQSLFKILKHLNPEHFSVIESQTDFTDLAERKNLSNEKSPYALLFENFNPDFDGYDYLWFEDIGLFELRIIFIDNRVQQIEDRLIYSQDSYRM